jgi:hypothetical protein
MCVYIYTHMCTRFVQIEGCAHANACIGLHTHPGTHPCVCMYVCAPCPPRPDSPLAPPMRQDERTPLFYSAMNGHTDTALALLQAGATVDARNKVRGVVLSLMSQALALLLSLSSLALFFIFIYRIYSCVCMCVYLYTYLCMYICIYMCMYIYVYMEIYLYIKYTYVRFRLQGFGFRFLLMWDIHIYLYTYVYTYVYT